MDPGGFWWILWILWILVDSGGFYGFWWILWIPWILVDSGGFYGFWWILVDSGGSWWNLRLLIISFRVGSGTMATLVLALNLANLFQSSYYEKYLYHIRFCWWGAEENNLLGAHHHVEEPETTTIEISISLQSFQAQHHQNDYVPFLFAGIPCAGTFSGTDTIKTSERRDRYGRVLGHGYDGIAGVHFDSCYHQACDTIENINPFGYETMVKSAAHVLETLVRIFNLNLWLYE
ncbi:unnamed protein product [Rotaria socialis]